MTARILLVEDSPTQAMLYKNMLEDMGLEVHHATEGRAALDYAFSAIPDLIILDINLPDMDGFQICNRLNRSDDTRNIPIIMLTERDSASDAWTGLQAGAIDYIPKDDYALSTLSATIKQLGIA